MPRVYHPCKYDCGGTYFARELWSHQSKCKNNPKFHRPTKPPKKRQPTICGFCQTPLVDARTIRQHLESCTKCPSIPFGYKVCLGCWTPLPSAEFGSKRGSGDDKTSRCRKCHAKQVLARYHQPHNKHYRRFAIKNKKYGVDEPKYNELMDEQGGVCALCKKPALPGNSKTDHLAVDHSHHGKELHRGLLCAGCNAGLGGFDDDIDAIKASIPYLEMWAERHRLIQPTKAN